MEEKEVKDYISFLKDGYRAAHQELDKLSIPRETVELEHGGKIQRVTEYPVCDRIKFLGEREAKVKHLLQFLVDSEECSYDHHGYCQTHNLFEKPCPNSEALKLLQIG